MFAHRAPEERLDRYAGPYERWVYSAELGHPFAFPAARRTDATCVAAILEGAGDPRAMDGDEVRLPPLWPDADADHAVTPFLFRNDAGGALSLDRAIARRIGSLARPGFTPRIRLNMPVAAASWTDAYRPQDAARDWRAPLRRPRAVIGVIDDGLPFLHRAFTGGDGRTRISHLWLQAAASPARERVPVGRELTNGLIDRCRAECGADERAGYRAAGAIDAGLAEIGHLLDRSATHGGHILGLSAGNDPHLPAPILPDEVQIVAVQLPNTVAWDTSGFGKEMFMLAALHYVFCRADEIARACGTAPLPLVVNFSYGWSAGRHDGQSGLELSMEELLTRRRLIEPRTAIVLPMGNTFASRMHAQFTAAEMGQGAARIGWRLPPGDRTSSYLEIWLPEGLDPAGWEVRLTPPPGTVLDAGDRIALSPDPDADPVGDPRRFVEIELGGRNVGQLSVDLDRGTRWRVIVAVIPTAESGRGRRLPAGLWTIEIDPGEGRRLGAGQTLDLWVQRDDDPETMRMGGRQSRLEGPPGLVRGFGCYSAICGAPSATRVAGSVGGTDRAASYSSAGGLRTDAAGLVAWGAQPTLAAPSDESAALPGLRSIGTVSGSGARLVGTSAAAALASRWMVANAAAGRDLFEGLDAGFDAGTGAAGRIVSDADGQLRHRARLGEGRVPVDVRGRGG